MVMPTCRQEPFIAGRNDPSGGRTCPAGDAGTPKRIALVDRGGNRSTIEAVSHMTSVTPVSMRPHLWYGAASQLAL